MFLFHNNNNSNKVFLNLGQVYEIAQVFINEKDCGICICNPYIFDITEAVVNDNNEMEIQVTNTLAKKLGNNMLDRAMPQEPSGLFEPVCIKW